MGDKNLKERYSMEVEDTISSSSSSVRPRALSTPSARTKWLSVVVGLAGPVLIPLFHIALTSVMWRRYNRKVDRLSCRCSCWDSVFKGNYEAGVASYKHVYFNATANTFWMWTITALATVALYECIRGAVHLLLRRRTRFPMLVLFGANIYPIYYAWWMYFNYINDGFYYQWWHQLYFTLTELASAVTVYRLIDSRRPMEVRSLLLVLSVGAAHVLISAYDQAVANVLKGDGNIGQVMRDLAFLIPDVAACGLVVLEMRRLGRARGRPAAHLVSSGEFGACVGFVAASWLLCLRL